MSKGADRSATATRDRASSDRHRFRFVGEPQERVPVEAANLQEVRRDQIQQRVHRTLGELTDALKGDQSKIICTNHDVAFLCRSQSARVESVGWLLR